MGKLIVIEGTDGSGKATQTSLLHKELCNMGIETRKLEFPRYSEESSALVRLYLGGAFGSRPDDVNAYAASAFFAVDRFASYKQDWGVFYEKGGVVVTDRYTTSNAVHQAPKLPDAEREKYVSWLFDFEYNLMGLPRPGLVIYLDMPHNVSEKLLRRREKAGSRQADIHEEDDGYLKRCRDFSLLTAEKHEWNVISCAEGDLPRPVEDIHGDVLRLVKIFLEV